MMCVDEKGGRRGVRNDTAKDMESRICIKSLWCILTHKSQYEFWKFQTS